MGSINKVKLLQQPEETYDISPSPNGTLDPDWYISEDSNTQDANHYNENISKIENTDDNKTIFSKITGMIRNIRYLFNRIGNTPFEHNTVTDAIVNLDNICSEKADIQHSHRIEDLPVTNNLENSVDSIPTSAVVYDVNRDLNDKYDSYVNKDLLSLTSSMPCGAIQTGTHINNQPLGDVLKMILRKGPDPNKYNEELIDTWNTQSDVVSFFNTYNSDNQWNGLKLGNYIKIKTYNLQHIGEGIGPEDWAKDENDYYYTEWMIAGFNCEKRETHDNGYGICLIPRVPLKNKDGNTAIFHYNDPYTVSYDTNKVGYKGSDIHAYLNNYWIQALEIIGDHLVNRDVLLSNEVSELEYSDGAWTSSAYTWTQARLTLLSVGQITNKFNAYNNKYDEGEATYYLPLFEQKEYKTSGMNSESAWWVRNLAGRTTSEDNPEDERMCAYAINDDTGTIEKHRIDKHLGLMPMMYINKTLPVS